MSQAPEQDLSLEERLTFLRNVPIFGGVSDQELERMARCASVRRYASGEVILEEGDTAREMFVVLRGTVEVVKGDEASLLSRLAVGDCFGEMSIIDIQPRSASVRAAEELRVLVLTVEDLFRLYREDLRTYTLIVMNIAREISRRLRCANQRISELGHPEIPEP